ncbi:hypothetical protein [Saccharothrix carnea]|uniref:hypothetical protein n=1 Tax=Saccharothrix carnea TaxID=1280637 RepID=UPI0015E62FE4|nr:hypothetical protein [Saccharothrix carnea]
MRGAQGAVALIAAVVLTACTNETQAAGPTSSSSSSTTATTTTTTKSVAEMLPRHVEEAAIPRHGLIDRGFPEPTEQEYRSWWMLKPCLVVVPAEEARTASLQRKWIDDRLDLRHSVMAFEKYTGAEFIDQLKAATADCTTWEYDNGQRYDVVPGVTPRQPAGLDAFHGFCVDTVEETGPARRCVAFLAHRNVVSSLYVIQRTAPLEASLEKLHELLPRVVEHLTT